MKKHKSCPWGGEDYETVRRERTGRMPRSAEAQRKRIDELLDILQSEGDFWTLEVFRRLLATYVLYDDRATSIWMILMHLNHADARQAEILQVFTSRLCCPAKSKKRGKRL